MIFSWCLVLEGWVFLWYDWVFDFFIFIFFIERWWRLNQVIRDILLAQRSIRDCFIRYFLLDTHILFFFRLNGVLGLQNTPLFLVIWADLWGVSAILNLRASLLYRYDNVDARACTAYKSLQIGCFFNTNARREPQIWRLHDILTDRPNIVWRF